ncbi:MAG: molecular chaperone HtpG [Kofleriaceae bacterium]|nr:molecular chaperone HtpG [Kofleriaceae bacterium]
MSAKTYEFKTETARLLELMIHSLYSNSDVFLRELISNASDALDKRRFASVTDKELATSNELRVRLETDSEARTLTIIDNGIGMSRDEVVANIGTIAKSGTKEFAELLKSKDKLEDRPDLIGQFGVGFYSSFLVANNVVLITRKAGEDTATRWESSGTGDYTIDDAERDEAGTTIILSLKDVDKDDGIQDYTDSWVVQALVRKYSDFVSYPIVMDKETPAEEEGGEPTISEETLNSQKAIWTRSASDVSEEDYNEFYKHISRDWVDPIKRISTSIEGTIEAKALLFIPKKAPFDLYQRDMSKRGVQLYVKRVFIMEDCEELLPSYLRFIKGVVDSEDLPLNVSREVLQQNRQVRAIQKHLVKKLVAAIVSMRKDDWDNYQAFWTEFGPALKEGLLMGPEQNNKLLDVVVAESTKSDSGLRSLADYVENMSEGREEIYYLTGTSMDTLRKSPHLETFKEKGIEVLLFTDPVDEIWLQQNLKYQEKSFVSASHGELKLNDESSDDDDDSKNDDERSKELEALLSLLQSKLDDDIKEVRLSKRLTSSAACLVTDTGDMSPQMEQLMRASGQSMPPTKRILEVSGEHPVIKSLEALVESDAENAKLADYAQLLHGQALLAEGGQLSDPAGFAGLVAGLMVSAAANG